VGERLAEINSAVTEAAEQETGRSVLPVLVARADLVDEEMERRFADAVRGPARSGSDRVGYIKGTLAADLAQLAFADLAASEASSR
jgi:hypothetical protein